MQRCLVFSPDYNWVKNLIPHWYHCVKIPRKDKHMWISQYIMIYEEVINFTVETWAFPPQRIKIRLTSTSIMRKQSSIPLSEQKGLAHYLSVCPVPKSHYCCHLAQVKVIETVIIKGNAKTCFWKCKWGHSIHSHKWFKFFWPSLDGWLPQVRCRYDSHAAESFSAETLTLIPFKH